jgi:hypothetical protein
LVPLKDPKLRKISLKDLSVEKYHQKMTLLSISTISLTPLAEKEDSNMTALPSFISANLQPQFYSTITGYKMT